MHMEMQLVRLGREWPVGSEWGWWWVQQWGQGVKGALYPQSLTPCWTVGEGVGVGEELQPWWVLVLVVVSKLVARGFGGC